MIVSRNWRCEIHANSLPTTHKTTTWLDIPYQEFKGNKQWCTGMIYSGLSITGDLIIGDVDYRWWLSGN